jgi:hypothetical protein
MCFVAKPERRENWEEPKSDDAVKSLMDEYLASTREPVVSRSILDEGPSRSPETKAHGRRSDLEGGASAEPSAMALYLICVAGLLVAALAYMFS